MALTMLSVHQAAEALLTCVCEALDRIPVQMPALDGCPCRTGVVAGAPAADGCDGSCSAAADEYPGQLTVNVVRTYIAELPTYTNLGARSTAPGRGTSGSRQSADAIRVFRRGEDPVRTRPAGRSGRDDQTSPRVAAQCDTGDSD